jgi:hypothetical protein
MTCIVEVFLLYYTAPSLSYSSPDAIVNNAILYTACYITQKCESLSRNQGYLPGAARRFQSLHRWTRHPPAADEARGHTETRVGSSLTSEPSKSRDGSLEVSDVIFVLGEI